MTKENTKLQVVSQLPNPPTLTPEALSEIERQAREWRDECAARVKAIETIDEDDLKARAR